MSIGRTRFKIYICTYDIFPLRAPLDQRISIGTLYEFLNELSPHSFSSKIISIQRSCKDSIFELYLMVQYKRFEIYLLNCEICLLNA
jgi:hypothetical protein